MIDATRHDVHAASDFLRLKALGINTVREGLRWHLIEASPGSYDFSSVDLQLRAAEALGIEVIWDLFHYGYPGGLDIFSGEFVERFRAFAAAFARFYRFRTGKAPIVIPVNEISFFSWVAGDVAHFFPFAADRGHELKQQMVRAFVAAANEIRSVFPAAVILAAEPAIHVRSRPDDDENWGAADSYRLAQFQAVDMLLGRLAPELGGCHGMVDIIGLNYYPHNQWFHPNSEMIERADPCYRPLSEILGEIYERYGLPLFIAETGAEGDDRREWFEYVAGEYEKAKDAGADLYGLCIYPIVNHPGWMDERHCPNGLWGYTDDQGNRPIHPELADVISQRFPKIDRPWAKAAGVS